MFREMSVLAISVSGFSTGFLDGCLCLMDSAFGRRHRDLWVMKEYGVGKSWTNGLFGSLERERERERRREGSRREERSGEESRGE